MTALRFLGSALVATSTCVFSMLAAAGPYSSVYVFGDSLSDIGRVTALTNGYPGPSPIPSMNYALGRFSNGPVAVETMTLDLTGSALSITHDYAYGGARTGVSPFPNTPTSPGGSDSNFDALTGTGLLNQTAMYKQDLGGGTADPNALYVVWAGSNDFTQAQVLQDPAQWARMIGNIETAIGNLEADGARHFFVPNIPNLGLTPASESLGAQTAAGVSFLTRAFDDQLALSLASFDAVDTHIDIKTFDTYDYMTSFIGQVIADGTYRGISDVTSMCQTTLGCDPSQAFFWDDEHPTAAIHAILGNAFAAALIPEPQTYAMLLAGLGAVGWATRRRRLPVSTAAPAA